MKKFTPKPGQIDFTHARFAPVVNCVVQHRGKILLVKRSRKMQIYPGFWNGVGGYLDDKKTVSEKAKEELREETGIGAKDIVSIRAGTIFEVDDPKYKKTWIFHPVLVKVKRDKIRLDWEADEYRWVTPKEAQRMPKLIPTFRKVLDAFFDAK